MKFNPKVCDRVIYIIGSLENPNVEIIANQLRKDMGPDVEIFDSWKSPGPKADSYLREYENGKGLTYKEALNSWAARHIFEFDDFHLQRATDVIMIMPAGRSGHLELGVSIGRGKRGYILFNDTPERYDIMVQFSTDIFFSYEDLLVELKNPSIEVKNLIDVNDIKSQIGKYTVPSLKDSEEYKQGYSDAVEKLYGIIEGKK